MGAHKLAVLIACAALGSSCTPTEETSTSTEALFFECGNGIRYPTTEVDFNTLYNGRAFYAVGRLGDGTVTYHLGHDIAYPEGEAIHPIACGRVVYYGPATGYGTLIVAIEHTLSAPTTVTNGLNEPVTIRRFISIYGHQRPSVERLFPFATRAEREAATYTRTWHRVQEDWDGSPTQPSGASPIIVMTDEVISYVEYHESPDSRTNPRNLNGDGGRHLHLGIRLQSFAEATSFMRGYDFADHAYRGLYADPAIFMRELMEAHPVLWHPPGTLLVNREGRSQRWLVGAGDTIHPVDETYLTRERLWGREVDVSPAELDCYHRGSALPYETWLSTLIRFEDGPAVYEWGGSRLSRDRYTFISHEAFVSWGWNDSRVEWWSSDSRDAFFARTVDRGFRRMRDGTLVKARGHPEVSVVSEGRRLPFFNWETFIAMGYDPAEIVEIDPSVIDDVAYPRGGMITPELARLCRVPSCSGSRCDGAGPSGGGGVELPPDDAGMPAPPPDPDAGAPPPSECAVDIDCPGYESGWRCRSGSCLETDIDGDGYLGSDGDCNIDVPRIHRGAVETCDRADEDCDGLVDEGFDLSTDPRNCGSCGRSCGSREVCTDGICMFPPLTADPYLVRIRLTDAARSGCPAGWVIKLWLGYPAEESSRGEPLERSVSPRGGHSAVTLWCDERSPPWYAFDASRVHALGAGIFAELSQGGEDLRSVTMLCTDPCNTEGGTVPLLVWDPARRGACPTSC